MLDIFRRGHLILEILRKTFPMHLKSSFVWLQVIGCFPFEYWNWEVGIFKRIWYYIYGIRPKDDHQRKIWTEISGSTKLELFIQRIVKEEWAKFIWNGDDNISAHIQDKGLILTGHEISCVCKVVRCDRNIVIVIIDIR